VLVTTTTKHFTFFDSQSMKWKVLLKQVKTNQNAFTTFRKDCHEAHWISYCHLCGWSCSFILSNTV